MYFASVIVGVCLVVLTSNALEIADHQVEYYEQKFNEFMEKYRKEYVSVREQEFRFGIFWENMIKAEELQRKGRGTATYGMTRFSDLTDAEFKQYLGFNPKQGSELTTKQAIIPNGTLPTDFDWRDKNAIGPVKDQGNCGSCWAFSTTGNIEGLWGVKHNKTISLSEQELLDCDDMDGACKGGMMTTACEAIMKLGGLELESDYPYKAVKNVCEFNKSKVAVTISGYVKLPKDEVAMAQWLFANGPVSIAIDATDMKHYIEGISDPDEADCNEHNLNHGVLLVGFGVSDDVPYWTIKNSWGPSWGEKGYYRIIRGKNACGLRQLPSSATL